MATANLDIAAEVGGAAQAKRPARGLTQRAYLNAFAALLDHAVKGGVTALVTPLLVAGLGSSLFGVWQMLSRLVTYMQAADGRPTQALKWVIAHEQASEDTEAKRRHVGSALGVWVLFLPVLVLVSAALVWVAPLVTKVPEEMYGPVRLTCLLLAANFLLTQLVLLPEAVLRGMNLGYKRMGLQASLSVVGGALTVGALWAGGGLVGLAGAQVVLGALTGVLFLLVVKKYVPWFGFARPTFAEVRSFLKLSVWWFAWTLINRFLMASDILILGFVASASAVATYSLTGFAGVTLMSLATTAVGAVTPGLGGVIGQKQFERAARLRGEMMVVSWLLLTAVGATILLWNRSFVLLWVGEEHYAGPWANLAIVVMIVQFMFIRNDAFVIDLTLQLREKVLLGALSAALSVALSALLIPRFGITGLCAGMIVGRLVLTLSYPLIVKRQLSLARAVRPGRALRPVLVTALMFAAAAYLGESLRAGNWLVWLAATGASFAVVGAVALFAGLGAGERASLVKRLTMLCTLRAAR
jgi:O-antigen/teichoic acid export membrane protein